MNDSRHQYPPTSAANVYPSPGSMIYGGAGLPPLHSSRQYHQEQEPNGLKRERHDDSVVAANAGASPDEHTSPENAAEGVARKKQKRNKPTLSCAECVERKTKASSLFHVSPKGIAPAHRGCNHIAKYSHRVMRHAAEPPMVPRTSSQPLSLILLCDSRDSFCPQHPASNDQN
jgi:hypothetical protein